MTGGRQRAALLSTGAMEFDASAYEGPTMKTDEVVAMRMLFEACDTEGSGAIPLKEFKSRLVVNLRTVAIHVAPIFSKQAPQYS